MSNLQPMKLLFVCRHNAVRSQVAEVLANSISHGKVQALSAGVEPQPVPDFIQEWAGGYSTQSSALSTTSLQEMEGQDFDLIITLCDKTHQALPELSTDTAHIRWDFQHPDNMESLKHLEIELSERLRLMFLAKNLI